MNTLLHCLIDLHDTRLILPGVGIGLVACLTALNLLRRAHAARRGGFAWAAGAAFALAAGAWAFDTMAMLGFHPGTDLRFNQAPAAASGFFAILASGAACLLWRRDRTRARPPIRAGLMLGIALVGLRYINSDAMVAPVRKFWDWNWVGGSVVIGIGLTLLAIFRLGDAVALRRRMEASALLMLGIGGLYFMGATALGIDPTQPRIHVFRTPILSPDAMAMQLGAVVAVVLLVALAGTMLEQHFSERGAKDLGRLRLLSSLSHEVMLIHRAGIILEINPAGERMFGLGFAQLTGAPLARFLADPGRADPPDFSAGQIGAESAQLVVRSATGATVPVEMAQSPIDYEGRPAFAMALRDLSDRRRNEERIRHLAHHDALTGLANRSLLADRLGRALDTAGRERGSIALLYIDLDRFKPVNDQFGHASGDELLRQVAARLRGELRAGDTLARIGGDEFVIVTEAARPRELITRLADRLIACLAAPFDLTGAQVEIGCSIGVALYPEDGVSEDGLLRAADTALYRVKEGGRGSFLLYERGMDAHVLARRALEADLRHALDRGELDLHFQPQVNCATGAVDGFEALVRWHHPTHGLIPPLELIPLAEQSGQMSRIGAWVLHAACAQAATWDAPYWVGINLSPSQFGAADLVAHVADVLERTGLAPSRLEIEITEGAFVTDRSRATARVSALRELGVRVSLDDFGGGHCTLSYLRSLHVDKLKVDQSFIKDLGTSPQAAAVLRAIVSMGHDLGLTVIAEGVETEAQFAVIQDQGCDHAQGFLLGRPLPHQPGMLTAPTRPVTVPDPHLEQHAVTVQA